MKATGMIRRVDELGRVVIPKEIRRTMRIAEGEPLEIYTEGDGLVLKKYSAVLNLGAKVEPYVRTLHHHTGLAVWVVDTHRVVAATGPHTDGMGGLPLSTAVEEWCALRKPHMGELSSIVESTPCPYPQVSLYPLLIEGDLYGAVLLGGEEITASAHSLLQVTATLLCYRLQGV